MLLADRRYAVGRQEVCCYQTGGMLLADRMYTVSIHRGMLLRDRRYDVSRHRGMLLEKGGMRDFLLIHEIFS